VVFAPRRDPSGKLVCHVSSAKALLIVLFALGSLSFSTFLLLHPNQRVRRMPAPVAGSICMLCSAAILFGLPWYRVFSRRPQITIGSDGIEDHEKAIPWDNIARITQKLSSRGNLLPILTFELCNSSKSIDYGFGLLTPGFSTVCAEITTILEERRALGLPCPEVLMQTRG
jgi:hypothetical protein